MSAQTDEAVEVSVSERTYETELVPFLVDKILVFVDFLSGNPLRPYQRPFSARLIESLLLEDVADITALFSRQSGKSETVCNTVAALMILLPRLAKIYPQYRRIEKFKNGLEVGIFAPVEEQAKTLFGRLVDRLTSEQALEIMQDPEIDDHAIGKSREIRLKKCKSRALMMTANPKAKIESKTFHLIVIDEAQDCDDYIVRKSISPMKAATAGTIVRTGTPNQHKGDFKRQIDLNKRKHANERGARQDHYEADWREVAKWSPAYKKSVLVDLEKMGEDSDEFQMAYCLKWMLDRGMFTTETRFEELGDTSMQETVKAWLQTPVVVGIDPARTTDSTVVTVVWVDWDRPDEFGMYEHRVLNWLELQGMSFEQQYFEIVRFLEPYNLFAVAVDAQGMGAAVAERLQILLRHKNCEVLGIASHPSEQNKRWKHLQTLMDRAKVGWPMGAKVRRLRSFKRFQHQMLEAEKHFQGPNILVRAPEEAGAHDDYVDSLALACYCTVDLSVPEVEVVNSPFYRR